jgi:hypothetical protein
VASSAEEFVGPFPSWADVKRDYGAVGDGKADDTAALQRALDDLREHQRFHVLYLPAGTYRVTRMVSTLRKAHTDCLGVAVIGEDPATTRLLWDGPKGGTLFRYDAWYSAFRRLTLDGAGRAGVCLAYGESFSTYNETSDVVFRDAEVGMRMGTGEPGQAENAVLRCRFLRCSKAGLTTVNFNSMDIWAWHCRFEDCGYGLLNEAGNFHAYGCLFLRSRVMDVGIRNLMVFSFVNNTSVGSRCFLDWDSAFSWGAQTSITGNRILDTTGDFALRLGSAGPFLFAGNTLRSRPGKKGPEVVMTWADQLFAGNTYTVPGAVKERGRFRRLDERVVPRSAVSGALPLLPQTPPHRQRQVFEVPASSGGEAVQKALDSATRLRGRRPVVHLPAGTYVLRAALRIPAGCDLQLVGDSGAETGTVLRWEGPAGQPALLLEGPCHATLRDLYVAAGGGTGIRVTGCDQPGGRVFGDQVNLNGSGAENKGASGLRVDGLLSTDVQMRCLQGGSDLNAWVSVAGRNGRGGAAPVAVYCGATGTSDQPYLVERGGRLLVRSVYHEVSGQSPQALLLRDSGSLSIDATRFSYATSADRPLIALEGFRGDLTLLTCLLLPVGTEFPARVEIRGDGSRCRALVGANCFWQNRLGVTTADVWRDASSPKAQAALLLSNMDLNPKGGDDPAKARSGYEALADAGAASDAFLRRMLQPLGQTRLWEPAPPRPGVTSLQLHRVMVTAGRGGTGLELRASGGPES